MSEVRIILIIISAITLLPVTWLWMIYSHIVIFNKLKQDLNLTGWDLKGVWFLIVPIPPILFYSILIGPYLVLYIFPILVTIMGKAFINYIESYIRDKSEEGEKISYNEAFRHFFKLFIRALFMFIISLGILIFMGINNIEDDFKILSYIFILSYTSLFILFALYLTVNTLSNKERLQYKHIMRYTGFKLLIEIVLSFLSNLFPTKKE